MELIYLQTRISLSTFWGTVHSFGGLFVRKDIAALEAVQKRYHRRISGMRKFSYHERFKNLNLFYLELGITIGDPRETDKIRRGQDRSTLRYFYVRES